MAHANHVANLPAAPGPFAGGIQPGWQFALICMPVFGRAQNELHAGRRMLLKWGGEYMLTNDKALPPLTSVEQEELRGFAVIADRLFGQAVRHEQPFSLLVIE
jgi:hypothetical protein